MWQPVLSLSLAESKSTTLWSFVGGEWTGKNCNVNPTLPSVLLAKKLKTQQTNNPGKRNQKGLQRT
jgi:hypothetical protein